MSILIDPSSGSKDLINHPPLDTIAELCPLNFSDDTRSSADVCVYGNGPEGEIKIGIEVKKINELLESIRNGRLAATQAPALRHSYNRRWLAFYEAYRRDPKTNRLQVKQWSKKTKKFEWDDYRFEGGDDPIPIGYLEAFLLDLHEIGIEHKHFFNVQEVANWIGIVHRHYAKQWSEHGGLKVFDESGKSPRAERETEDGNGLLPCLDADTADRAYHIKRVPGFGYERAVAAAKHFRSVRALIEASEEEWREVEMVSRKSGKKIGIGPVLAKAAVRHFGKE
jgi:hypothetical protein